MTESNDFMIKAKGLTKIFGSRTAVNRVSFNVEKGEILGFLGPNAAGKTTTMKMLTCFYPPTMGTAIVNGFDVMTDSLGVRRSIGFMPENVPVYLDMTVTEYLNFVARAKGMAHLDINNAIKKTLGRCSLDNVANQLIRTVSRGYRQRVGLAQAIINEPPVLILDEPTVGLDPEQIKNFRELIISLAGQSTIILSTHILSEVSLTCNKVCILDHGNLVAADTPANLESRVQKNIGLRLQILAPSQNEVMEVLKGLQCITNVVNCGGENIANSKYPLLTFKVEAPKDSLTARREINHVINSKNWEIYGIQDERISLEDVFINLVREYEDEADNNGSSSADKANNSPDSKEQKVAEEPSGSESEVPPSPVDSPDTEKKEEEEK
ncbi:MAG: ABC transporter ATP-binding protein [Candidatus Bruticola sp.]